MKEKIQSDLKEAMKARDQRRVETLRGLLSEIKLAEIETKAVLPEDKFIQLVKKEIKKRKDAIEYAKQLARQEIIEQNEIELKILEPYLGEQLSEAQIEELVRRALAEGADSVGKVMAALNRDNKGKFDGKTASSLAQRLLAENKG